MSTLMNQCCRLCVYCRRRILKKVPLNKGVRNVATSESVRRSVCTQRYLKNQTELDRISVHVACGPCVTALRYVMYNGFADDSCFHGSRKCCVDFNEILLNDKHQQLPFVGGTKRTKSAIYNCFLFLLYSIFRSAAWTCIGPMWNSTRSHYLGRRRPIR